MNGFGRQAYVPDEDGYLDSLDTEFSGRDLTLGRVVVGTIVGLSVAASFGIWGYAYSGKADRTLPDLFDEPTFAAAAGPICDDARAEFETLPGALDAVDHIDRANQIRTGDAILVEMVDELETVAAGSPRDLDIIGEWLADWRTYIGHREDFANRFEEDPTARFYLSPNGSQPVDEVISLLATTNEIHNCATIDDIG